MITCFRHYVLLAKTRSGMTTAITFFRQNDAGSREQYLVLRKSRTCSRLRLRVQRLRQMFSLFLRAHCPFLCSWNKCKYDQWWEVKFVGEGIIDQGGGFRDSLAELADELCPLDENVPEILPYLIRTPNQKVLSLKHHTL